MDHETLIIVPKIPSSVKVVMNSAAENNGNQNGPSSSAELLKPSKTSAEVPSGSSRKGSELKESKDLLLSSGSPQSFEVQDDADLPLTPTKYRRNRKNCWGLWLDTSGEDDDGAYKISGSFALLSVGILVTVGILTVKWCDAKLPVALQVKDIPEHPNTFIEERARKDLHDLISVGVRVSGSYETDTLTVNRILEILTDIRSHVLVPDAYLEFKEHRPTNCFTSDSGTGDRHTSCYSEIANVVAKLSPTEPSRATNHSILINCHFDTKPGSPGATDNMISCVTMLEIIRVLAAEKPTQLKNSLVFLFNGAEELGLQGAHGFVKGFIGSLGNPTNAELGHPWSKDVKTFINLEGAGGGGREILFQTGPGNSWTLETYAKAAPYPYGTCTAEEAFQFGLIPSDTDFRIFRDYGDLAGLDMAFIKNGWVYHTKWDKDSEIPAGSIQHMGANTLAILRRFTTLDFSEVDTDSSGKMVYYDVLGLFMIFYPRWVGMLIDALVAVATIAAILLVIVPLVNKDKIRLISLILWLPFSAILSWIAGIGMAALVAVFLNGCGYFKPFYSYPLLASLIFGIPAALAQILVHAYAQNGSPLQTWLAQKMALAVILLVTTFVTRAVYILTINLLFSVIAWNLMRYLCRGWPRAITLSYLICGEFIPFLMSFYLLVTLSDNLVPTLGRSGSETNANLYFGMMTAAVTVLLISTGFTFIFVQFRKRILWTCLLASFFVLNTTLVFGLVGKIPYQEKTPMRLNIVDMERTWYKLDGVTVSKEEAGYWLWPYDSNTRDFLPVMEKFVPELNSLSHIPVDYNKCESLYCAQPFMWPMTKSIKRTHWLPRNKTTSSSNLKRLLPVTLTTTVTNSSRTTKTVQFSFDGPTQMSLVLSPGPNYRLVKWTLTDVLPKSGTPWQERDTYFIYHGRGVRQQDINFSCEFQLKSQEEKADKNNIIADEDILVTVLQSGFYVYGPDFMTKEFHDLVNRLPSWTYTMPWAAQVKVYDIKA